MIRYNLKDAKKYTIANKFITLSNYLYYTGSVSLQILR